MIAKIKNSATVRCTSLAVLTILTSATRKRVSTSICFIVYLFVYIEAVSSVVRIYRWDNETALD
jgi:hypothetical protein